MSDGNGDGQKSSLSQIETRWSLVMQANQVGGDTASAAQRELLERYAGAVHRYLLRVTRDPEVAADLAQEFALRFLRGGFHRADPTRGRFRNYVKSAVMNLVIDAHRQEKNRPCPLPDGGDGLYAPIEDLAELDRQFLDCWRDEVLRRAWDRLAAHQRDAGQPFHTVLRFRADNPTLRSQEIADRLSVLLKKPVTAGWVRQNLRRARDRFVTLVQDEVAHSLNNPTPEERDEELMNLGLWDYVRGDRVAGRGDG